MKRKLPFFALLVTLICFPCFSGAQTSNAAAAGRKVIKVGVIGGGIAGATFARTLEYANSHQSDVYYDILVLERSDRIGGRMEDQSYEITLGNGQQRTVVANVGTQLNFEAAIDFFRQPAFLDLHLDQMFTVMKAEYETVASEGTDGNLGARALPIKLNPKDFGDLLSASIKMYKNGLVGSFDAIEASLTSNLIYEALLKGEKIGNIVDLKEAVTRRARRYNADHGAYIFREDFDSLTAMDFVKTIQVPLNPTVTRLDLFNPFKWKGILGQYANAILALESGNQAALIGSATDFWTNVLVVLKGRSTVGYPQTWIDRVITPTETIVEFTDLNTMSAMNFLWQNLWVQEGGKLITSTATFSEIPKKLLQNLEQEKKVKFNQTVVGSRDLDNGGIELDVIDSTGGSQQHVTIQVDRVFTTSDPKETLKIFHGTKALSPAAQQMLSTADYTSTIGLFLHTKGANSQDFFGYPSAALSMQAGLVNNVGGITFRSGFYGDDLSGDDIVSCWIPSEATLALLESQKQNGWSEETLLAEAKKLILRDIGYLASRNPAEFGKLNAALIGADVLGIKVWPAAVPKFQPGYATAVAAYRKSISEDHPNVIFGGQATSERTFADTAKWTTQIAQSMSAEGKGASASCGSLLDRNSR
jgi:protoporphyrinogen oxidase